jgi:hypothetical protein
MRRGIKKESLLEIVEVFFSEVTNEHFLSNEVGQLPVLFVAPIVQKGAMVQKCPSSRFFGKTFFVSFCQTFVDEQIKNFDEKLF